MMPPMPTTGTRTAPTSSCTMRSATGLMAGPERPPLAVAPEVGNDSCPSRTQRREAIGEEGLHADVLEADRVEHAARCLEQAGRRFPGRGPEREPLHRERAERAQVDQRGELGPVAEGAGSGDDGVRQPDRADRDARIDAARTHRPPSLSSITIASWPGP